MDEALVLVRVVIGLLFVGHGTGKLFGWFAGDGVAGTAAYFGSLGYPRARAMAVLAGLGEVAAGIAFGAGLLTPLAVAALVGIMANAAVAGHGAQGLWAEDDGYEYPLVVGVVATAVALAGPGEVSVDAALGWEWSGLGWAAGAGAAGVLSAIAVLSTRRATPAEAGR